MNGDEAKEIQIVLDCKETLRWRNADSGNETLFHYASFRNRNDFLSTVLQDEEVHFLF